MKHRYTKVTFKPNNCLLVNEVNASDKLEPCYDLLTLKIPHMDFKHENSNNGKYDHTFCNKASCKCLNTLAWSVNTSQDGGIFITFIF